MRPFTWAVAWFIVGLGVTLGTASVLQQVVTSRHAAATPVFAPIPLPDPGIKPPAEGRDVLLAARRFNRFH